MLCCGQNVSDLSDLVISGREKREEEQKYLELLEVKKTVFLAKK